MESVCCGLTCAETPPVISGRRTYLPLILADIDEFPGQRQQLEGA